MKKQKFEPDWEKTAEYYHEKYEKLRDKAMTLTTLSLLSALLAALALFDFYLVLYLLKW